MKQFKFTNKPVFHQINCTESRDGSLDLRQSEGIVKYRPDIVLLEYPSWHDTPYFELNNYPPKGKPAKLVQIRLQEFPPEVLKTDPWAAADTYMWREIAKLWSEGKQIYVYPTDGPGELLSEWRDVWEHLYPQATKNWVWWVQIYLRERLMANNIKWVMNKHVDIPRPVINVYLQYFHWKHVKFLLTEPSVDEIWDYYFSHFVADVGRDDIGPRIKKLNSLFYRYWQKYGDFADIV